MNSLAWKNLSRAVAALAFAMLVTDVVVARVIPIFMPQLLSLPHAVLAVIVMSLVGGGALWPTLIRPLLSSADAESARFRDLMDSVPEAVIVVDSKGTIRILNARAESLFGYARKDMLGHPVEMLMAEAAAAGHAAKRDEYMQDARLRPMGEGLDIVGRHAGGHAIPLDISLNQMRMPDGRYVICTIRDMTEHKRITDALRSANDDLNDRMRTLKETSEDLRQLSRLTEYLQGCSSQQEAGRIVNRMLERLLPGTAGAVYLFNASRDLLQLVSQWGADEGSFKPTFGAMECWCLRRGRLHVSTAGSGTIRCEHSQSGSVSACIPMMAQGEVLGIVNVDGESTLEAKRTMMIAIAEQVGLALANLRLRQELKDQSIRDSLTGLFNRRFMEESLEREMRRCTASSSALSLVTMDLDHFKRFNDRYGHEAGDLVLRKLAALVRSKLRGGDLACRLGGEELVVLMPETALDDAAAIAETLRRQIEALAVIFRGEPLGTITASFGVAEYPRHGENYKDLLRATDLALYKAKRAGRNQVVTANSVSLSESALRVDQTTVLQEVEMFE